VTSLTSDNNAKENAGGEYFNHPEGILVLPDGQILIGDSCNHRLCIVHPSTGTISNLTGCIGDAGHVDGDFSLARFHTPRGLALTKWGEVAVADSDNDCVRVLNLESRRVRTVSVGCAVGTKEAYFNDPFAIALTKSGDLCVTEFRSDRLTILADRLAALKVELFKLSFTALPPAALTMLRESRRF